jgi:hypothetical protein
MIRDREFQGISIVVICVAIVLVVGVGAVASEPAETDVVTAAQETTTEDGETDTVSIQNLSAPEQVQIGENFTVSADVVNEDDRRVIQRVTYRIGGNVISSKLAQISPNNTTTVVFNVTNTSDFPAGTFTHGVFTDGAEATANLTLTTAEETTPEETTTPEEATPETTTPEETTPEETTPEEAQTASVTFEQQTSNGTAVVVNSVTAPEGGFVVVHDTGLLQGNVTESIVGTSEFIESGTQENVTIELDEPLNESQRLIAVVYRDSNENQEFDYVSSGRTADGPYTQPDGPQAVNDIANVTVENDEEE